MPDLLTIVIILLALSWMMGVYYAINALQHTRTAQGTTAWVISLLTIPFLAVPLYAVFGRNKFSGYRDSRRSVADATMEIAERAREQACDCQIPEDTELPLLRCLSRLERLPATIKNRFEILIDGNNGFDSIIAGIESAEKYVLAQFYIIRGDEIGRRFREALCNKAREGVPCYLLYDEIGCYEADDAVFDAYEAAGVNVTPFNPTDGRRHRYQLNFRNHRKIVVVDGKSCWIGGLNVGDEYLGNNPKFGPWRDTHARLDGPATLGAQLTFCMDWYWARSERLQLDWTPHPVDGGDVMALVFPSDPAGELEGTTLLFHQVIDEASERLWLTTPYFVPDPGIVAALQAAALRGVDVRIIYTEKSDHRLADLAAWTYLESLLAAGVRVFLYQGAMMHQKVILVDDHLATVGSANFDNRSFRLNFEVTLVAIGDSVVRQVEDMLRSDLERCREVTEDELQQQSAGFVIAARLARLTAPLL